MKEIRITFVKRHEIFYNINLKTLVSNIYLKLYVLLFTFKALEENKLDEELGDFDNASSKVEKKQNLEKSKDKTKTKKPAKAYEEEELVKRN